jgi:hypothetical protein
MELRGIGACLGFVDKVEIALGFNDELDPMRPAPTLQLTFRPMTPDHPRYALSIPLDMDESGAIDAASDKNAGLRAFEQA